MKKKRTSRKKMILRRRRGIAILLVVLICVVGIYYIVQSGKTVIAIDPGHGGNDIGASDIVREVDINEATAEALVDLLRADSHYRPVLCRSMGKNVPLDKRGRRAERAGAELLLSIHANAGRNGGGGGFECYPAPPGRPNHGESATFAHYLVEEIATTGMDIRGDSGVRYLYYQNGEKVFREEADSTVYDLRSLAMVEDKTIPAVLVEQCFVTVQADVDLLGTEEGCQRAAVCYYRAICKYFGTEPMV